MTIGSKQEGQHAEPAATAVPSAVPASPQPAGLVGALTPAFVLAMQRTAGNWPTTRYLLGMGDVSRATAANRATRRLLARDPEDEIPGGRVRGESTTIGSAGEREEVGRVRKELEKQGYDKVYDKGQMARRAGEIAADKGTPKPFDRSFADGRARPDIIAINTKEKKVLILDLTKEPGTTTKLQPGDRRPLPNDAPPSEQVKLHFEKTLGDAKQVARRPPGGEGLDGFKVVAQERYWATGEYSREVDAGKITEPSPAVLAAEAEERAARRAAKQAEKAKEDAERKAKKKGSKKGAAEKPAAEKPAPAKPAPTESAADTPAKPAPAKPAKPAPAESAAETPAKPAPAKPSPAKPAPAKPSPAKPAPAKPGSKPTASKPSASEPSGSKPKGGPGSAIGTAGSGAAGAVQAQALKQLNKLAQEHPGDKDLVAAVDTLNKALDAKSLVENPKGFIAEKIKAELIQAVFDRFAKPLKTARQSFEAKCPAVGALHNDPLDTGISLEGYKKNYDNALAALKVPNAQKTFLYVLVLMGLDENTPREEVEQRIALANEQLAKLPGMAKYVKAYNDARDRYNFALAAVTNQLGLRDDELAKYAGVADDLRRRAEALETAAKILNNAARELWESNLVVWAPVLAAAQDLETLGDGFAGLGRQLREFADTIDRRKGEYDREFRRLHEEGASVAANALRAHVPG